MGLKRRHKKKKNNQNFDPNRVVKLDHKCKCYAVDEAPTFPLIATPRQLQKRFHYFSESDSNSEQSVSSSSLSSNGNDEFKNVEYIVSSQSESKDLIRIVPSNNSDSDCSSNDFKTCGGTAPANPKNMLGKEVRKLDGPKWYEVDLGARGDIHTCKEAMRRERERELERLGRVKEPKSKRIVQIQPYRKCSVSQKY